MATLGFGAANKNSLTQQIKTGRDFHATQKHNSQACCSSVLADRRRLVQRRKKSLNGDGGGDIRVLHMIECAMRARSLFGLRWQKKDPAMRQSDNDVARKKQLPLMAVR